MRLLECTSNYGISYKANGIVFEEVLPNSLMLEKTLCSAKSSFLVSALTVKRLDSFVQVISKLSYKQGLGNYLLPQHTDSQKKRANNPDRFALPVLLS